MAATLENELFVDLLIRAGADVNVKGCLGRTPVHEAAACGTLRCLRLLRSADADANVMDPFKIAPLHLAAETEHAKCVQLLIQAGASIEATDAVNGTTPLHRAALCRSSEGAAAVLVAAGADPFAKTTKGFDSLYKAGATPLELAQLPGAAQRIADAQLRARLLPLIAAGARGQLVDARLLDHRL
jgi:ankyrin repeat protein